MVSSMRPSNLRRCQTPSDVRSLAPEHAGAEAKSEQGAAVSGLHLPRLQLGQEGGATGSMPHIFERFLLSPASPVRRRLKANTDGCHTFPLEGMRTKGWPSPVFRPSQVFQTSTCSMESSVTAAEFPDFDGFSRQSTVLPVDAPLFANKHDVENAISRLVASSGYNVSFADPSDPDRTPIMVSDGFVEMTGHPASALLGTSFRCLQNDCDNDPYELMRIRVACMTGQPVTVVLTNRKATGELFRNLLHLRAVTLGTDPRTNQEVCYLFGIHMDVTESDGQEFDRAEVIRRHSEAVEFIIKDIGAKILIELAGLIVPESSFHKCGASSSDIRLLPQPFWRNDSGNGRVALDDNTPTSYFRQLVPESPWSSAELAVE